VKLRQLANPDNEHIQSAPEGYNVGVDAPTDEKLIRDFLAGKPESFELLVRRHSPELYQFIVRFIGDSVSAEDIVQEAFLQVYHSASDFDPNRRFKPWLFTIAANKARDYLRRQNRRREVSFEAQVGNEKDGGQRFLDLLSRDDVQPDEDLQLDEQRRLLKEVMDSMPAKYTEVLVLAYYHRFPYKEIAEILGIPLGTVKSRLHAAIAAFSEQYQKALEVRTKAKEH
jgi:RNA polymerase sigma-70 factor (ECF subfamily)